MNWKENLMMWGSTILAFVAMMFIFSAVSFGEEPVARERVFDLPQDADKWFISVVGDNDNAHFNMLLGWFDTNEDLVELKGQVHFHKIATDSTAYRDRYIGNTMEVPMIRIQKADGYVVYEVAGGAIPDTAQDMLTEIGFATFQAGGPIFNRDGRIFPIFPVFRRPLLPYRYRQEQLRQQEGDCDTCPPPPPAPPSVRPPQKKPEPKGVPTLISILAGALAALGGAGGGVISKWKSMTE